jgi:hypothetical protein
MELNLKLKEYIDDKSVELIQLMTIEKIEVKEKKQFVPQPEYFRHKQVIDLGEIIGPLDMSQEDFNSKLIFKMRNFSDEKVGYNAENFKEIHKLTNAILKDKIVDSLVSYNFIVSNIFEWLISSYRDRASELNLSKFLEIKLSENIIKHKVFFPVLFLESDKDLNIANVNFKYISDEFISELANPIQNDFKEDFLSVLAKYKGTFVANCEVLAEKNKAISIAIDCVTYAIDILKITSPTIDYPQMPIHFDADFRNVYQVKNEVLIQTFKGKNDFNIEFYRKARPFEITDTTWNYLLGKNISFINSYSLSTFEKKSELDTLINKAIRRFAKAISNTDLHERITQIFSVLESLLLPSESSAIIDSVCKYLPKILTKDLNERDRIISITKELYKVRSSMIHHGHSKEFEIEDLASIQRCTLVLIKQLMEKSSKFNTKQEVLNEIDELVHRA